MKKDLVIAVLATFCLTATIFMILPTKSATSYYDPWADVSGPTLGIPDGRIDMRDIAYEVSHFGTFGTPIDRSGYSSNTLPKPDYDSGWLNISRGTRITLPNPTGTTDVLVYMIGKSSNGGNPYIHQIGYGAELNYGSEYGCDWETLTATSIQVYRRPNDPVGTSWDYVRVMIWKIPT
jgi:hypothetical protein